MRIKGVKPSIPLNEVYCGKILIIHFGRKIEKSCNKHDAPEFERPPKQHGKRFRLIDMTDFLSSKVGFQPLQTTSEALP